VTRISIVVAVAAAVLLSLMLAGCEPEPVVGDLEGVGVDSDLDCDDSDPAAFPGALEVPDDGIDQNCDGTDAATCFYDGDGDGYGWPGTFVDDDGDCTDDEFESDVGTDCDDAADWIHPGAEEIPDDGFDQDCSGADRVTCYLDLDGDGWAGDETELDDDGNCTDPGQAAEPLDCDDDDLHTHPGAADAAEDGIDQDCNGVDAVLCYFDGDGDGYGWPGSHVEPDGSCDGANQSPVGTDCDDAHDQVHPGAEEVADDGIDQDCSGSDSITCFEDGDEDGYGDAVGDVDPDGSCTDPGQALVGGDCDDADPDSYPWAAETPDDGVDQDCDGSDGTLCFFDGDGDGYGWPGTVVSGDSDCDDAYESEVGTDCDDALDTIHPGAEEVIGDGIDQDCDGVAD